MLAYARVEIAGHAHTESAGGAGHDVDPEFVESAVAHAEDGSTGIIKENSLLRHGRGGILGILRLALTRASLGLAQDDSLSQPRRQPRPVYTYSDNGLIRLFNTCFAVKLLATLEPVCKSSSESTRSRKLWRRAAAASNTWPWFLRAAMPASRRSSSFAGLPGSRCVHFPLIPSHSCPKHPRTTPSCPSRHR